MTNDTGGVAAGEAPIPLTIRISGYLIGAAALSAAQFGFFDCNGLPAFAFGAGMACVMSLCLTGEMLHRLKRSPDRGALRIALIVGVGLLGAGATIVLGVATVFLHLCG